MLDRPEENINEYHTYKVSTGVPYVAEIIVNDNVGYRNTTTNEREMRNIKTGEKILPNISYTNIFPIQIGNQTYDKNIVCLQINGKWGFYQLSDGKEIVPPIYDAIFKFDDIHGAFISLVPPFIDSADSIDALGNTNYIFVESDQGEGLINYTNNSIIIPPQYKYFRSNSDKILWNEDVIFDYYGNMFLKGKYDKIYGVEENYALVQQGENIKLLKIDGEELYVYKNQEIIKPYLWSYLDEGKVTFLFHMDRSCTEVIYDFEKKTGKIEEKFCPNVVT